MENKGTVVVIVTLVIVVALIIGIYTLAPQLSPSTKVVFETNMGTFTVKLYDDMPITTGNFVKLVNEGFYDGILFHRVIPGFVIQGGDPLTKDESQKAAWGSGGSEPIRDEKVGDHSNKKYTISMANAGPNTGSSQFFINLKDNLFLDSHHPVFGEVVDGKEVIDAIALVSTGPNDIPNDPVIMEKVYVE